MFTEGINQVRSRFINQTSFCNRRSRPLAASRENADFKALPHWLHSAGTELNFNSEGSGLGWWIFAHGQSLDKSYLNLASSHCSTISEKVL